jgi:hypothetical protein
VGDVQRADRTDTVAEPAGPERAGGADSPALPPYRLDHLLLLDSAGNDPLEIESLVFTDDGVGVVRRRGEQPRVLPWSSVSAHAVERWSGGIVPEWWVDPELNRTEPAPGTGPVLTDPDATSRAMPHIEPGALIGIKTPTRTYRFLLPAGDPKAVAPRIAAFALRQQGPAGASTVTTVARAGTATTAEGRDTANASRWSRIQPVLVVLLVALIATAVTLILLQSAGAIHLPFLGGANTGLPAPVRTR